WIDAEGLGHAADRVPGGGAALTQTLQHIGGGPDALGQVMGAAPGRGDRRVDTGAVHADQVRRRALLAHGGPAVSASKSSAPTSSTWAIAYTMRSGRGSPAARCRRVGCLSPTVSSRRSQETWTRPIARANRTGSTRTRSGRALLIASARSLPSTRQRAARLDLPRGPGPP